MRIREVTLVSGGAADNDSLAASQAVAGAAANTAGIAALQATATGVPMTLTGAAASLDPPRQLTFTSAADFSGDTFDIVGTDADGNPQTVNNFAGPNNTTVTTAEVWGSVTSITPDDTNASTISVGWPTTTGDILVDGLTLTGAAADIAVPREVTLTSGSNLSAITFTITGRDRIGNPFEEEIVGPNADTVTTRGVFGSVDSIVPSATSANSVSAGLVAGAVSPWYLQDTTASRDDLPNGSLQVLESATPAAGQVEYTHQNAARIVGAGAEVDADPTTIAGTAGEVVILEKRPWFRIRNTEDTGTLKVAIARPRF